MGTFKDKTDIKGAWVPDGLIDFFAVFHSVRNFFRNEKYFSQPKLLHFDT